MITLTSVAKAKLKEIMIEQPEQKYVRLGVRGGGCSGYEYTIGLVSEVDEHWLTFEFDGVTIVVDPMSLMYIEDVTLDYVNNPLNSGFKFNNPAVKTTCGCGSSFST
jgi:iron-sulfur cluster assembly protein